MRTKYDFGGWATKNNLKCSDGRTIHRNAFSDQDGSTVPLVWNHDHKDQYSVLGHALLENRDEGVYAYCKFNDTEAGENAKTLVKHGDICSLSIYANQLKQNKGDVMHGKICEVSLVLAGANPGARIDDVMMHADGSDGEAVICMMEDLDYTLAHSEETEEVEETNDIPEQDNELEHSEKEKEDMAEETKKPEADKTVGDVLNTLTEEQKTAMFAVIGQIIEDQKNEGGKPEMKHNLFDSETTQNENVLCHADQEQIISMAKSSSIGSLREAMEIYADNNQLEHNAFDDMTALFPEHKLIDSAEPAIMYDDDSWVNGVISGVHKSPIARIKTRRADARKATLEAEHKNALAAKGYKKGEEKKYMDKIKLLGRTHDAQTIYIKDKLDRDDILDITDFDVVNYEWKIMRHTLNQTLAQAILIGDGRSDLDPDKIKEDRIRPIWHDDDLYCIHQDIDFAKAKAELQGTNTSANFGENYIYAEALITAALYSREKYKGSGNLTFYCTPHALNVMLLARDLNGRRIYSSKADLVAALNVKDIQTIEQFEGLTRTTADGKTKKMVGLFVNLKDYQLGCVKGGEITQFSQFDIDFNQEKMLLETRCSGALVEWYSAIALEEDVTASTNAPSNTPNGAEG